MQLVDNVKNNTQNVLSRRLSADYKSLQGEAATAARSAEGDDPLLSPLWSSSCVFSRPSWREARGRRIYPTQLVWKFFPSQLDNNRIPCYCFWNYGKIKRSMYIYTRLSVPTVSSDLIPPQVALKSWLVRTGGVFKLDCQPEHALASLFIRRYVSRLVPAGISQLVFAVKFCFLFFFFFSCTYVSSPLRCCYILIWWIFSLFCCFSPGRFPYDCRLLPLLFFSRLKGGLCGHHHHHPRRNE